MWTNESERILFSWLQGGFLSISSQMLFWVAGVRNVLLEGSDN